MLLCCGCFGRTWCTLGSQPPLEKRPSQTSGFCSQMMYVFNQSTAGCWLSVSSSSDSSSLKSLDQSPTSMHLGGHTLDNSSLLYNSEKWIATELPSLNPSRLSLEREIYSHREVYSSPFFDLHWPTNYIYKGSLVSRPHFSVKSSLSRLQ